ncbi:MAG: hypothetical protein BHK79_10375 [Halanaerobium sp. MDAL1]|nr:MAG: hypothetical protein BHK79_10375 [Halanaerobium sp. MDAL1]
MKKQIEYLGRKWELKRTEKMYNGYEGWTGAIFQLADTEEKGEKLKNINCINGKFNRLTDKIHIAIERISSNPKGTTYFNQLFVAFKDFDNWQGELPEWNDN